MMIEKHNMGQIGEAGDECKADMGNDKLSLKWDN